jgi:predicted small secreted protein
VLLCCSLLLLLWIFIQLILIYRAVSCCSRLNILLNYFQWHFVSFVKVIHCYFDAPQSLSMFIKAHECWSKLINVNLVVSMYINVDGITWERKINAHQCTSMYIEVHQSGLIKVNQGGSKHFNVYQCTSSRLRTLGLSDYSSRPLRLNNMTTRLFCYCVG